MRNSTGYANHADYVFGWQGDALQRALDSPCYVNCPTLKNQTFEEMNKCTIEREVKEDIDSCKPQVYLHVRVLANQSSRAHNSPWWSCGQLCEMKKFFLDIV